MKHGYRNWREEERTKSPGYVDSSHRRPKGNQGFLQLTRLHQNPDQTPTGKNQYAPLISFSCYCQDGSGTDISLKSLCLSSPWCWQGHQQNGSSFLSEFLSQTIQRSQRKSSHWLLGASQILWVLHKQMSWPEQIVLPPSAPLANSWFASVSLYLITLIVFKTPQYSKVYLHLKIMSHF